MQTCRFFVVRTLWIFSDKLCKILRFIRMSGTFARKWLKENADGRPVFNKQREAAKTHQLETVGAELRAKMNWNK